MMSKLVALTLALTGLAIVGSTPASAQTPGAKEKNGQEQAAQATKEQELESLTGVWQLTSLESDGKQQPLEEAAEIRRVQVGDRITWKKGDQTLFEVHFVIDAQANPKRVDSTYLSGDNKGKTHLGIYRLEGDEFTLCFASFDKPRPTEFATSPQSGQVLYKAKRVAK